VQYQSRPTVDKGNVEALYAPALLSLGLASWTMRSDEKPVLNDAICRALVRTKPLKRLERIGFLGAIDYVKKGSGRSPYRRRHNRLEHSIGVAKLAEHYCDLVEMAQHDRDLIVAAALLHDVGHGPLSHTLEPVFEEVFGINHHRACRDIIRGDSLGTEVVQVLRQHRVDPDEVIALIDGEAVGDYSFLFASQLNLDTLEGITRCRAFVGPRPAFGSAYSIVSKMADQSSSPQGDFDQFWQLKHDVYALFINAQQGRVFDTLAQAYMRNNLSTFAKEDFLKTEVELKRSHADLFRIFRKLADEGEIARDELPSAWLESRVEIRDRRFFVRHECVLDANTNINERYRQSKEVRTTTLDDLLS